MAVVLVQLLPMVVHAVALPAPQLVQQHMVVLTGAPDQRSRKSGGSAPNQHPMAPRSLQLPPAAHQQAAATPVQRDSSRWQHRCQVKSLAAWTLRVQDQQEGWQQQALLQQHQHNQQLGQHRKLQQSLLLPAVGMLCTSRLCSCLEWSHWAAFCPCLTDPYCNSRHQQQQ